MRTAPHPLRVALASMALVGCLALAACSPPPALPKAELDAKRLPKKHPKVTEQQRQDCRSCHKEAPAIRTQGSASKTD